MSQKPPRCLVTGAAGFCGRYMVEKLVAAGAEVIATDLPGADAAYIDELPNVTFMPADILDKQALRPLLRNVGWVFHIAALFDYTAPIRLNRRVNVFGTRNLCEAALLQGVEKMVVWSSIGVYGTPRGEYIPVREDTPKHPGNFFDQSKLEMEIAVQEYIDAEGLPALFVRPAPMYGPRNRYGVFTMVKTLAALPIPVVSTSADNRLPFVHVVDAVAAALWLARGAGVVGEAYNVVDNTAITVKEFTSFVCNFLGREVMQLNIPMLLIRPVAKQLGELALWKSKLTGRRPGLEIDTLNYLTQDHFYSNIKLRQTGFKFGYPDVHVGLVETLDWYKQNEWL